MRNYIKSGSNATNADYLKYDTLAITPANAAAATGNLKFTGVPLNDSIFTVGGKTYRFRNTLAQANDILISTSIEDTIENIVAAIVAWNTVEGTKYGTGTTANEYVTVINQITQAHFTYKTKGTIGNSSALAKTGDNMYWEFNATYLAGGVDGTVGKKGQTNLGGNYMQRLYICTEDNTIVDANWRYINLVNYAGQ